MPTATTPTRARVSLTPLPSLEDADLVRRARDGDDDAFEEIVRRYRAPLIRYSTRHVGRDHAEDITQHALASAAMHLRDDPRPIHLRAWLYRVAHNAAINMRQRKDWGHEQISPDIDGVPQPPDVAAQRSEVRKVVSDLDRLPDRQRTALLLSVFEGLGYEEIAARLDTTPNSVRALLSRARVHLRQAASAIAPIPLLQLIAKKISGLVGAASGSGGTVAAGGTVIQANLVAVAATAVTAAGAATAQNAISSDRERDAGATTALVEQAPVSTVSAVRAILIEPALQLSAIIEPTTSNGPVSQPPAGGSGPVSEPVAPVIPIAPPPEAPVVEPAPPPPADEAPPVEEPPPAEQPADPDPAPVGHDPSKDETDNGDPGNENPVDGDPVGDGDPPPGEEIPEEPAEPPIEEGESGPPEDPPPLEEPPVSEEGDSTPPAEGDSTPPETPQP